MSNIKVTERYQVDKKVVHFTGEAVFLYGRAYVTPVDHPDTVRVTNTQVAQTSTVVAINEDGSFETLNSIYRPVQVLCG
jgi:hypothetical protein